MIDMKQKILLFLIFSAQFLILTAQHATISYEVIDLKSGEVVASQNPELCATPASVTKLITTSTALELLGGDFQFSTYIETNGSIEAGVLNGDLIIRGGADPTLGSIHLGDRAFLDYFVKVIKQSSSSQCFLE